MTVFLSNCLRFNVYMFFLSKCTCIWIQDRYVLVNVIMHIVIYSLLVCWYRFELSHCLWYHKGLDKYWLFTRLKGAGGSPRGVAFFFPILKPAEVDMWILFQSTIYIYLLHIYSSCLPVCIRYIYIYIWLYRCIYIYMHTAFAFQPRVWDTVWHA